MTEEQLMRGLLYVPNGIFWLKLFYHYTAIHHGFREVKWTKETQTALHLTGPTQMEN